MVIKEVAGKWLKGEETDHGTVVKVSMVRQEYTVNSNLLEGESKGRCDCCGAVGRGSKGVTRYNYLGEDLCIKCMEKEHGEKTSIQYYTMKQ